MRKTREEGQVDTQAGQGVLNAWADTDHMEIKDPHDRQEFEGADLPDAYGETRVVLLPIEPYRVHAYWEVTAAALDNLPLQQGSGHGFRALLRFHDITETTFNRSQGSFDVQIDLQAKNTYVHLWHPNRSYTVELGLETVENHFYPLARSNVVRTPPSWLAQRGEEYYLLVKGGYQVLERVPNPNGTKLLNGHDKGQPFREGFTGPEKHGLFGFKTQSAQGSPLPSPAEETPDLAVLSEKAFLLGVSSNTSRSGS